MMVLGEIPHYHLQPTFSTLLSNLQMLLEETNSSFPCTAATFQFLLTPSSLAWQEPTFSSERKEAKQERWPQKERKIAYVGEKDCRGSPMGPPIATSEKHSACTCWGREQRTEVRKREMFPSLNLPHCLWVLYLRPAPAFHHPFFLTLSTKSYLSLWIFLFC